MKTVASRTNFKGKGNLKTLKTNIAFLAAVEAYKRGLYSKIPIGRYARGKFFYPTKKQIIALEKLNDDTTTHVGYGGSARSGKSIIECTAIILDCFAYPGIAWGLARKELTTLKRTVLLTMFKQLRFYGISDFTILKEHDYTYNQQLNKIIFPNGSEIFLIDTAYKPTDPLNTRFGGFELTRSAIDESNETQLSVVNKLFERTGWRLNDKYNLKRKQFECFNPDKNHVYSRYYLPYRDKVEPDYKVFIPALPGDNPHPSVKEWCDDIIKTGDLPTIERQIKGNFDYDDDPAKMCEWNAICDMFTNDHVQGGDKWISADLAMQGRDRFIAGVWDGLICTYGIDQAQSTGESIMQDMESLKIRNRVGMSRVIADKDGLGNYLDSFLKGITGFRGGAPAVDKDYGLLKDECAFKLAEFINKRDIKVICNPEQQERVKLQLSTCLKRDNVNNDKKRMIKKELQKELLGHKSPDDLDMLLMGMLPYVSQNMLFKADAIKLYSKIKTPQLYACITGNDIAKTAIIGVRKEGQSLYIQHLHYDTSPFDPVELFEGVDSYVIVDEEETGYKICNSNEDMQAHEFNEKITTGTFAKLKEFTIFVDNSNIQAEFNSVVYDGDSIKFENYPALHALLMIVCYEDQLIDE